MLRSLIMATRSMKQFPCFWKGLRCVVNSAAPFSIKLWKISETAPYFHRAHLLVVADCAALCHINIHDRITPGRIPLLCCPETDFDISMKLCKIIELNDIRSVAVVKMNAECCADLTEYVQTAIKMSRKPLPLQTINVFVDAEEVE